ncbi:unnamed protein product [Rotaria sp. Silwood2]|nr:unnamed protein product [Rotaria sp. Silwood2]
MIQEDSTCCRRHLDSTRLIPEAIALIRKTKSNTNKIERNELLSSLDDLKITFKRLQSMLDEANQRPAIDFDVSDRLTDEQYFILTGITKDNFGDLCSRIPSSSLRRTQLRSAKQAIGCLLVKLRLGLSNSTLATLFSLPDVKAVSRILESARVSLMDYFVPRHLGFEHISRRDVIDTHTRPLAKRLFTNPGDDKAILILDGTYIYVQKSANNIVQRRTFSIHKGRPLVKPMMIVSTDGYIISAIGPYMADYKNNDASMPKHIMLNNREGVTDWLEPHDVLIVDRGFRDCLPRLSRLGYETYMPAFLKKAEKQLTTTEANLTRFVTKIRWVVESANGRIKTWRFFDHVVPNSMLPIVGDLFSIICALINAYRPLLVRDVANDNKVADIMLSLMNESNKLKEYINSLNNERKSNLKWTQIDANNAVYDFPILSLEQLNDITLGWFQLKQAKRYTMEHLSKDGSFTVQIAKQRTDILRARIQSRHRAAVTYNLYIQYSTAKIEGWYCECLSGGRIIGCCSHIASVLWYLALARYMPKHLRQRSNSYLDILDDARDCSDLSDDDSEEEDSQALYMLV